MVDRFTPWVSLDVAGNATADVGTSPASSPYGDDVGVGPSSIGLDAPCACPRTQPAISGQSKSAYLSQGFAGPGSQPSKQTNPPE